MNLITKASGQLTANSYQIDVITRRSEKEINKMKGDKEAWIEIGEVGVDSGQLMVCDPGYIDSEWEKENDKPLFDNLLKVVATGKLIPSSRKLKGKTFDSGYKDGMTHNEAIQKGILEEVPEKETGTFSYRGCSRATIGKGFGQLNYKMGHAGAGVAFSSGWGDGCYKVFAKFKDFGERGLGGKRITEVRILLIEDDGSKIEEMMGIKKNAD